jgi:uncharacterized protein (TIGR02646 family)
MIKVKGAGLVGPLKHGSKDGDTAREEMIKAWRADPTSFEPEIHGDLYRSIKEQLMVAQGDKCCFCETKISAGSHGDVEHYRPKKAVTGAQHGGYWWLAYEPSNLLLSCQVCNQSFKGNKFPLKDEAKRAMTPDDVLADEEPLLINPMTSDPERHIGWRAELPYGLTSEGAATIQIVGLDRDKIITHAETGETLETGLCSARWRVYERLRAMYRMMGEVSKLSREERIACEIEESWQEAWDEIQKSVLGLGEAYQGMLRAAFRDNFEVKL